MEKNNIPKHWQVKKLGEVCEIIMGQSPPSTTYNSNGVGLPFFQGKAEFTELYPIVEKWCDTPNKIALPNDILLSVRAPVGTTNIANQKCCIGRGLAAIRYQNYKYLFYFLRSIEQQLDKKGTGTTFRAISGETIRTTDIPIPPLPEQHAIVSKIEELFSELENGKQQLQTALQQLKVYRQSLLNLLATDKGLRPIHSIIDKLDQGWSPKCLNENSKDENEWAVIKTSAVQPGHFIAKQNKILPKNLKPREQHELNVGDILITRAGPRIRVGVCCMIRMTRPRLINCDKVYRIKVNTKIISPEYFELILNTPFYQREIEKMKSGISDSGLNLTQSKFLKIEIPIPSIVEQQLIVQEIESKLTVCDKIEETITQSLLQAETLRQSILKKAFEGKLVEVPIAIGTEQHEVKVIQLTVEEFPKKISGIAETDLQAGIISMVIDLHQQNAKHADKLSHVKCEKISDLVERKLGISLGRVAMKDAAGPDDFNHLKKVEHRAKMAGYFKEVPLPIGHTYQPMRSMQKAIAKTKSILAVEELNAVENLLKDFLPFELEHAELVATLFEGWNNLLLLGKNPTDEEIVYESRENWSARKLTIERSKFFKTLQWMKDHHYIPEGKGQLVMKKEELKKSQPKKSKKKK